MPLAVIIPFAIMVWNGWSKRRDAHGTNDRCSSAAILVVVGPAIGRLPIAPPTTAGFTFLLLLGLALFIPMFVHDRKLLGEVHPATKLGFAMGVISIAIPLAVFWFNLPWAGVAARLPGVGA